MIFCDPNSDVITTQFPNPGLWIISLAVIRPSSSSRLHIEALPGSIQRSLCNISATEAYELFPVTIASPWFIMFGIFSNVTTFVWTISTINKLDEASPLYFGRLSIDSGGSFGSSVEISNETSPFFVGLLSIDSWRVLGLVKTGGFILLCILNGLVSSHISCRFFSLFSLSSFWMSGGNLIGFCSGISFMLLVD